MPTKLSNTTPEEFAKRVVELHQQHKSGNRGHVVKHDSLEHLNTAATQLQTKPEHLAGVSRLALLTLKAKPADLQPCIEEIQKWEAMGSPLREEAEAKRLYETYCKDCGENLTIKKGCNSGCQKCMYDGVPLPAGLRIETRVCERWEDES